jgi:hypothetical protein
MTNKQTKATTIIGRHEPPSPPLPPGGFPRGLILDKSASGALPVRFCFRVDFARHGTVDEGSTRRIPERGHERLQDIRLEVVPRPRNAPPGMIHVDLESYLDSPLLPFSRVSTVSIAAGECPS